MSRDPLTRVAEIIILLVICSAVVYGAIWTLGQILSAIFRLLGVG